jgi:hypothetical protein
MKKLTDNLQLITGMDELYEMRRYKFANYVHQWLNGYSFANWSELYKRTISNLNGNDKHAISIDIDNFNNIFLRNAKNEIPPLHMAFSLITLYKDEQQNITSIEYHKEKMDKVLNEGMTSAVVQGEVENFTINNLHFFQEIGQMLLELRVIFSTDNEAQNS